jgi:predicted acylesterase/phospholipase RssA
MPGSPKIRYLAKRLEAEQRFLLRFCPTSYTANALDRRAAYTLGAPREIEGMVGSSLDKRFDLIFGTSTGAIIAALLALGRSVDDIHALYKSHVVTVMAEKSRAAKTAALAKLAVEVFGDAKFDAVTTGVGIVTTKWLNERPMIFKGTDQPATAVQLPVRF